MPPPPTPPPQVDAPLEIHLKRKHWASGAAGQGQEQQDSSGNARFKKIFLDQMAKAEAGMGGAGGSGAAGSKKAKAGGGKKGQANVVAIGARARAQKMSGEETEEIRQQVIEAYRSNIRKNHPSQVTVGGANLDTLARLVKKGGQ